MAGAANQSAQRSSPVLSSIPLRLVAMAAISTKLTATLPFPPTLRPRPRRLPPDTFTASASPHRTDGVGLYGYRVCNPSARRFHGFENTLSVWTQNNKQVLFASDRDSPSTGTKQSSSGDNSSTPPDGPPVLTILAGVIVFLLVLWVIGSIVTWIVGLVFGAAKS